MRMLDSVREGVYGSNRREKLQARRPEAHAIDIENHLDSFPGADHLNWRTSIVDLLELIGVDSSPEAREALARELGYDGTAKGGREMDNWLHERVMGDLADQGGAVPPEFSD
jgi:hypothetical protein